MREAKPRGSQTSGFPTFFGKGLSSLFFLGAVNRLRKRQRTNRGNPRRNLENPGKIGKVPKRTQKEGQVQIGKPPCLKPPCVAALNLMYVTHGISMSQSCMLNVRVFISVDLPDAIVQYHLWKGKDQRYHNIFVVPFWISLTKLLVVKKWPFGISCFDPQIALIK